jgi:hypothetical protein
MHRDLALALACVTALALALFYVAGIKRSVRPYERKLLTQIQTKLDAVEQRVERIATDADNCEACTRTAAAPAPAQKGPPPSTATQRVAGAGAPVLAPDRAQAQQGDPSSTASKLQTLRHLLETDRALAVANVDELIASAEGLSSKVFAMRCMSLLAEVRDAVSDAALQRYTHGKSGLLRLHAAKLLQRRGDPSAVATVAADLAASLDESDDIQSKVQVLGLLQWAHDPASVGKILPALHDPSSAVRHRAVMALDRFDDESVHAAITPLLRDPDRWVQQAAERVLASTP